VPVDVVVVTVTGASRIGAGARVGSVTVLGGLADGYGSGWTDRVAGAGSGACAWPLEPHAGAADASEAAVSRPQTITRAKGRSNDELPAFTRLPTRCDRYRTRIGAAAHGWH
jgi:hypothetical protein